METLFFLLNCFLCLVCLLTNAIHCLAVYTTNKSVTTLHAGRILPSLFLLITSVCLVPIEIYTGTRQGDSTTDLGWIFDKLEILHIGMLLGLNLLTVIIKLRCYNCKGIASSVITKKFILLAIAVIVILSLSISITLYLYRPTQLQTTQINASIPYTRVTVTVEMIFYHVFGILPTIATYLLFLILALRYLKSSSLKRTFSTQPTRKSSPMKQFSSIRKMFLVYLSVFFTVWIPFAVLKMFCVYSNDFSVTKYAKSTLSLKIMMFTLNPIANGMLQKRCKFEIREMFLCVKSIILSAIDQSNSFLSSSEVSNKTSFDTSKQLVELTTQDSPVSFYPESPSHTNENILHQENNNKTVEKLTDQSTILCVRRLQRALPMIEIHHTQNLEVYEGSSSGASLCLSGDSRDMSPLNSASLAHPSEVSPFLSEDEPQLSQEKSLSVDFPLCSNPPRKSSAEHSHLWKLTRKSSSLSFPDPTSRKRLVSLEHGSRAMQTSFETVERSYGQSPSDPVELNMHHCESVFVCFEKHNSYMIKNGKKKKFSKTSPGSANSTKSFVFPPRRVSISRKKRSSWHVENRYLLDNEINENS